MFCFGCIARTDTKMAVARKRCIARQAHKPVGEVINHRHPGDMHGTNTQVCNTCGTLVVKV